MIPKDCKRLAEVRTGRGMRRALLCCSMLSWFVAFAVTAEEPQTEGPKQPLDLGLTEQAERRLVQLDVSVQGPPEVIRELVREDFELIIDGQRIEQFILDRIGDGCQSTAAASTEPSGPTMEPPAPNAQGVNYLFYFDQAHLTQPGRLRAHDLARELVTSLVTPADRATIVSSGEELRVYARPTADHATLLAALDRIEGERQQWVLYAGLEDQRVEEVIKLLRKGLVDFAKSTARRHQREEAWNTQKALQRLSMVLGRFAGLDPPKVVLYFADNMRSNPGQHYVSLLGSAASDAPDSDVGPMNAGALMSGNSFDRVINAANAQGVRLYPVQAEGLVTRSGVRVSSAQDSLKGFALETGGKAFLNGIPAKKIASEIQEDLSCGYLISFDATELPEEKPLRVLLRVTRPRVTAHTRGRLYVQSHSAQLTSRLLAAFATSSQTTSGGLRGSLIPTAFKEGKYSTLVQVVVPASQLPGATWDVGASIVSQGKVSEASGRATLPQSELSLVFESEMAISPGEYELIMVAHEKTTDRVLSSSIEGTWPDPKATGGTIASISIMQPAPRGIFLREDRARKSGALACGEPCHVRTDSAAALLGLVCRDRSKSGESWKIERQLIGESETPLPTLDVDFGEERCVQVRDLIPANTLGAGGLRYEIRAWDGAREVASASRAFDAVKPDAEQDGALPPAQASSTE